MKPLFKAALLFALAGILGACSTPSTRRDLYAPHTTQGPYTKMLKGE